MKKISIILAAFAFVLTMSQCKKNEGQSTSNDEVVTITLDVKNNDNSKVVVNTATGTVDFETDDKIYVGSGGKYVGFLTHNGTNFSGNITNPTENQPLQFYFLGNITPQETLSAGTTEECSVIISDQTEHLPVISCAASNENYVSGVTAYSAHLLNKCALVKFNVTTPSNSPICVTGMKNKVTVDFTQNTMAPSMDGEGLIMLPAGNGENVEKWAILLPQEALEEGTEGTVHSKYGDYLGIRPAIPAITNNGYLIEGINLTVNTNNYYEGAINGLFTINSNGNQVFFSKGNLQYQESTNTWKFADNQLNYYGEWQQDYYQQEGYKCDLFCWGASGYNHGAVCFDPVNNSHNYEDFYAYNNWQYNLFDQTGQADWGYNAISNGGNQENSGWRTPTMEEWDYIINNRNTISDIRWTQGYVDGQGGTILLPDNWDTSIYELNNPNGGNFNSNIITGEDWINIFEPRGAVFLPAAGMRRWESANYWDGVQWNFSYIAVGSNGYYWSSSVALAERAYCLSFYSGSLYLIWGVPEGDYRYNRCSVRLVKDYNP